MGNGPAGLMVLLVGGILTLLVALHFSRKRNADGTFGKVNPADFGAIVLVLSLLVFFIAIVVTFTVR